MSKRKRTKVICTIHKPIEKSNMNTTIEEFIKSGADIFRINLSFVDSDDKRNEVASQIQFIRETAKKFDKPIMIMGDLMGAKVRIKQMNIGAEFVEKMLLNKGEVVFIADESTEIPLGHKVIWVNWDEFVSNVIKIKQQQNLNLNTIQVGDIRPVLTETTQVQNPIQGKVIPYVVDRGGEVSLYRGLTVKNITVIPPYDLEKMSRYGEERKNILFLLQNNVDIIALSFVNNRNDVEILQDYVKKLSNQHKGSLGEGYYLSTMEKFPIIAKIETPEGVENLQEILEISYGIMIARGDLALQKDISDVPIDQKKIIRECLIAGKPVIVATQMLSSMVENPEPTRAEAVDVATAVFDGADALMLSDETAIGKFKKESIEMMVKIIKRSEEEITQRAMHEYEPKINELYQNITKNRGAVTEDRKIRDIITYNSALTAHRTEKCCGIAALSETGGTILAISRFRPTVPLLAGVYSKWIANLLQLSHGVEPYIIGEKKKGMFSPFEQLAAQAKEFIEVTQKGIEQDLINQGCYVVQVGGFPPTRIGKTTYMHLQLIEDSLFSR